MITLKVKKLCPEAVLPRRAHNTDAGLDLVATSRVFDKDGNVTYGTGLAFEIPDGHVGLLFPRDSGYRGEVKLKFKPTLVYADRDGTGCDEGDYGGSDVTAHGRHEAMPDINPNCLPFQPRVYEPGERIGQMIVLPIPYVAVVESTDLSDSERGADGFGSSGK